jgi:choline dehydrogenase-like flavoprotein
VIELHSDADFTVAAVGFSPGFPYLSGLPERLNLPRKSTPRLAVPAGSVAIAGGQAGIYPTESPGGWHLLGTARMGADARDSVTNQFGKTWDVDNLYLTDGSVFASKAHKNPTITIMALAMRSADNIASRLRTGEL